MSVSQKLESELRRLPMDGYEVDDGVQVESLTADHATSETGVSGLAFAPYCCCVKYC